MIKHRFFILSGSLLLIVAGFLPWISVPNLFGLSGRMYEAIEIGWEGDGTITAGVGLTIILGEILLRGDFQSWFTVVELILSSIVVSIVFLDFLKIIELSSISGFIASTEYGIFLTLLGALLVFVGCFMKLKMFLIERGQLSSR